MDIKVIKKYKKYTIPQLRKKAQAKFNKFIRKRDEGKQCCSCDSYQLSDASHFYSAGHYPGLAFHEKNVHASCAKCNRFLHGNLNEYRKKLPKDVLEELDGLAGYYKRNGFKHDRFDLIEVIEKYK